MYKKIFILLLPFLLFSCSTHKLPPSDFPDDSRVHSSEPPPIVPLGTQTPVLERLRFQAERKKDWGSYIQLTQQLWLASESNRKIELEQETWLTLSQLNAANLTKIKQSDIKSVADWAWFIETQNLNTLKRLEELRNIQLIVENPMLQSRLVIEQISEAESALAAPNTIAVMLPLSGRLESIGKQVRAGILKSYWHQNSQSQLIFYDTETTRDIHTLYLQAKQAGAEKIIGPLTRENIQALSRFPVTDLIALNRIDNPSSFIQLGLHPLNEKQQIIQQLNQQCARHIALLHSNHTSDISFAQQLNQAWLKQHPFAMNQQVYSVNSHNLRNEMASILNVNLSQERGNYLSRIIQQPVEYEPRTRQDLDTMLLIGDDRSLSILGPQLEFFQLKLNLIGTSKLTPQQLYNHSPQRDLKKIRFPTHPASLIESPLRNNLEALGWDSYLIAHHSNQLEPNMFIQGSLGKHYFPADQQIDTKLVWAEFENNGRLKPVNRFANSFYWQQQTKTPQKDQVRQQLLDEIFQFPLDLQGTSIE